MPEAPAPLFRDPIFDGAADPTVIWNRDERAWWVIYTCRRANVACAGLSFVHGTDLGVASSSDGGRSWLYRGILPGLEFERGRNTFWAPEILWEAGRYHMYVSYVRGVPNDWSGHRRIVHLTSEDLWDWTFESVLPLSSEYVIDACVHRLPDGHWRMWYKDEAHGSHTYAADSADLSRWTVAGPVITDRPHEGPNVFHWRGAYWMLTDPWCGLGVYRSDDALTWTPQPNILVGAGTRPDDGADGKHADVVVCGDRAYVFYFTHPGPERPGDGPLGERRSSLQVAELDIADGCLVCDRDRPFDLQMAAP